MAHQKDVWNRTISSGSSASNFQFSRASNCHLCHTGIDPEIWVQNASFSNSAQCDHLALHSFNNLHYMNIGRTTLVFLGGVPGLRKNRKCTPMNIERPPSSQFTGSTLPFQQWKSGLLFSIKGLSWNPLNIETSPLGKTTHEWSLKCSGQARSTGRALLFLVSKKT
jgi:hypothetical protein